MACSADLHLVLLHSKGGGRLDSAQSHRRRLSNDGLRQKQPSLFPSLLGCVAPDMLLYLAVLGHPIFN